MKNELARGKFPSGSLSNFIKKLEIDKRFLWIVFLVSFSLGSFFVFCFHHPIKTDAGENDKIGWNLAQGNGFSSQTSVPFAPTMYREPVYPYILGAIYKIYGHNYAVVYLFQIFIFSSTCILVYFLARDIFSEKAAKYSAFFAAICPTLANYPSYLLTETLFTFLLCLSILVLTKAVKAQRALWFLAFGIIFAITSLCKTVTLLFIFVVFFGVFLLKENIKYFFKRSIFHLAIFSFAFLIVILPWIYRNYRIFGTANISLRGGQLLWGVAYKLDASFEDMKKAAVFNFSEFLGNLFFPGTVDSPRDFILITSERSHTRKNQLYQQNFNEAEADKIMMKEAVKKIRAHRYPFLKLLAQFPLELIKMTAFSYIPTLNEKHIIDRFYSLSNGKILLSGIKAIFRLSAYPLLFLAIIGIYRSKEQWQQWLFLLCIIIYINIICSILFGLGRFAVPLIPFYLIFASAGILGLKQRFMGRKQYL